MKGSGHAVSEKSSSYFLRHIYVELLLVELDNCFANLKDQVLLARKAWNLYSSAVGGLVGLIVEWDWLRIPPNVIFDEIESIRLWQF